MKLMNNVSKEEKKLIRKMFWRSGAMYASVNPVTMGGGGFCYSMIPFINHFYKDNEEKRREALVRHVKYFSTTIPMASFVMGIAGSMEKENSEKPDFDAGSINSIKLSLIELMDPASKYGTAGRNRRFLILGRMACCCSRTCNWTCQCRKRACTIDFPSCI